jgi:hypothetical protein
MGGLVNDNDSQLSIRGDREEAGITFLTFRNTAMPSYRDAHAPACQLVHALAHRYTPHSQSQYNLAVSVRLNPLPMCTKTLGIETPACPWCQHSLCVTHLDGDTFNNTRSNLEIVTHDENRRRNTRGANGVRFSPTLGLWIVFGRRKGNHCIVSLHGSEEDAKSARKTYKSSVIT